jgi:integrase
MNTNLREAVGKYLNLRRSLGYKLVNTEYWLKGFLEFLEHQQADHVTTRLALEWARLPKAAQPAYWSGRLSAVRLFAQYRQMEDPRTEIPPQRLLSQRTHRTIPYIYSKKEVHRLVEACKSLPSVGIRPHTYSTLFGLIAVTGCRIGEMVALDRDHFRDRQGLITIHASKFGKSRLIPLHQSTVRKLRRYEWLRDRLNPKPRTNSFFVSDRGTQVTVWSARRTFIRVSKQIGLRRSTDTHGPRIQDLRHTFAVTTILRWYHSGANVDQMMPLLSTYLGHRKPSDTYWYLTAVPELLALAASRLEHGTGG